MTVPNYNLPLSTEENQEEQKRAMSETAISLSQVGMKYINAGKEERTVLDNVSLEIKKGEFVSFLGPSGCGKTTLLKIIADLIRPTSGNVTVSGRSASDARKENVYSMVFQNAALLDWRTVEKNVALPLELRHIPPKKQKEIISRELGIVDLNGYEKSYPHELSGGMKQRVGIARALANDPEILLMDEPFSALDEFTKRRLQGDILRIFGGSGKTVVFVTHDISEAVFLSDRIFLFSAHPARLVSAVKVDLPRPRENAVRKTPEFFRILEKVRDSFEVTYGENI